VELPHEYAVSAVSGIGVVDWAATTLADRATTPATSTALMVEEHGMADSPCEADAKKPEIRTLGPPGAGHMLPTPGVTAIAMPKTQRRVLNPPARRLGPAFHGNYLKQSLSEAGRSFTEIAKQFRILWEDLARGFATTVKPL
jgi:hypothetical protein